MSNKFSNAIATVAADRTISATNKKRMSALALIAAKKDVAALMREANVDASRFDKRAMYASEKVVKLVAALAQDTVSRADFNDNAFATMKTILMHADASSDVTSDALAASLSSDVKLTEEVAAKTYQRKTILSASTLAAQSQQCRDMLKTLNVVREVARNTFAIDQESAIFKRASEVMRDLS